MKTFNEDIKKIHDILKGQFTTKQDRQYWIDKLEELEKRKESYKNNLQIRNDYMKGVKAYKKK